MHPFMSCAEIFGETSNHPGDSALLQPRFGTLQLLAFPKTKITYEREEISDHWWDSGKYNGAADRDWQNRVRSQGAYFEGDWGVIVLCSMFLVSFIFFRKCLYFSYVDGYFLDRPHIPIVSHYSVRVTIVILQAYFSLVYHCFECVFKMKWKWSSYLYT